MVGKLLSRFAPRNVDKFRLEKCQIPIEAMTTILNSILIST